jgi:peptidoglycan hydrolase-like protein with peptidoglycan-binding domain
MWSSVRTLAPQQKVITYNGQRPDAAALSRAPIASKGPVTEPELPAVRLPDQFESGPQVKARPALLRGTTGLAVRKLQKTLHSLGFLSSEAMATGPGVFGPRTEQALKAFQDAQGLKPTGQLDALTDLALQKAAGR